MTEIPDLERLSWADFEPHIGSRFALFGEDDAVISTRLLSCVEKPSSTMPESSRTAFTLILEAEDAAAAMVWGGAFLLRHDILGKIGPLYVERVLSVTVGTRHPAFQVIFN